MGTKMHFLFIWACCFGITVTATAQETIVAQSKNSLNEEVQPDVLVTNDGDVFQVFNLDYSSAEFCYYTLSTDANADMKRIAKKNVLIIKLSNGTKIDPSATKEDTASHQPEQRIRHDASKKQIDHAIVTHYATQFQKDKYGNEYIQVENEDGSQTLYMQKILGERQSLKVVHPIGKRVYNGTKYIIPEYVMIYGVKFEVKCIGENAFDWVKIESVQLPKTLRTIEQMAFRGTKLRQVNLPDSLISIGYYAFAWSQDLEELSFPEALQEIGDFAFSRTKLKRVILPENIVSVGEQAFFATNMKESIEELYIPEGIKKIGNKAFVSLGNACSYRGFYQGYLTGLPNFITKANCTTFGIDEEAVDAYRNSR